MQGYAVYVDLANGKLVDSWQRALASDRLIGKCDPTEFDADSVLQTLQIEAGKARADGLADLKQAVDIAPELRREVSITVTTVVEA
jgi:hypothetical protein